MDGKRTNRSTKQTDKRKAMTIAQQWEDSAKKGRAGEFTQAAALRVLDEIVRASTGDAMHMRSVSDHLRDYLEGRIGLGKADATVSRYRSIFDGFLKSIGPKRAAAAVGTVTPQEIERFRNEEIASGKAGSTADLCVKVLRGAFEAARRKGLCLSNPAQAVELTAEPSEEREVFTADELRALLAAAGDTEWHGMILVGVHAGLRIGDAASLTWSNVNLATSTLTHLPAKTRRRSRKPTVIFLHPQLSRYLQGLKAGDAKEPIFPRLASMQTGLSSAFVRLMDKAGLTPNRGREKTGKGRQFRA